MGALLWVAKMLLKVMKPFVKIALIESLVEVLMGYIGNAEDPTDDPVATPTDL